MAKKMNIKNPLRTGNDGGDTPPSITLEEADRAVYGGIEAPTTNRIVARPVALTDIKPDVKQPRRIIPASIRRGWTGDVSKIPDMLREWRVNAELTLGEPIDTVRLIEKFVDGRDADKDIPPIADEYLALCALAASIKRDGLANPIQVTRANVIVTGERRYMAHWLLHTWIGGFDTIPAQVVGEVNVWLQAAENGARKPLNAIGMARQLALLIMEMYHGDDGVKFDDISFFDHERLFYAQVANGNIWRIKKGYGERVLQVTGLKSLSQVNQYRALLSIPNNLWDEADMNNYTEGRIRDTIKPRDVNGGQEVNSVYTSTIVEVSDRRIKQRQRFDELMRPKLEGMIEKHGYGMYCNITNAFIFWKNHTFIGLIDNKPLFSYSIELMLKAMFTICPDYGTWRAMSHADYDRLFDTKKTLKPLETTAIKRVMHDIGIGEDDDPIQHPFGGGSDMDNDPEYQVHLDEVRQIENDFADYVPPDLKYTPPKDRRYVAQDTLLHHFIAMVIGWGGMYNHTVPSELTRLRDMTPLDVQRMVERGLAPDEIAQELDEIGNRVLEYISDVHQQLVEAQAAIWRDAGGDE